MTTRKCFSFGVKHEKKFKTMSLKLDDESTVSIESIITECEEHLGKPLTKRVFYKDNRIYPNFKKTTKLYEGAVEVGISKYEDRACDIKVVLEIGRILLNGDEFAGETLPGVGPRARPFGRHRIF